MTDEWINKGMLCEAHPRRASEAAMTEIEKQALALLNEVRSSGDGPIQPTHTEYREALCRAIEREQAFRQEVSDAVSQWKHVCRIATSPDFDRFIIAKPDPLVDALREVTEDGSPATAAAWKKEADMLRAALAKRGLEIREKQ